MARFTRSGLIGLAAGLAALVTGPAGAEPLAGDMSLGKANAPVEVIEYASLTCNHCAAFHTEVFPAFKAKYVDTGKVRYIFREVPTAPVDVAAAGFLMARCAGPTKYFKVVDEVFRSQPRWYEGEGGPRTIFVEIAKANGLSEQSFNACITDPAGMEALNARVDYALTVAKVRATPSFFVNGNYVGAGELGLERLDAAIAAASGGER